MRLPVWLLPAAVVISGCATVAPIDQERADAARASRRAKLEQVNHFSVQARVAATARSPAAPISTGIRVPRNSPAGFRSLRHGADAPATSASPRAHKDQSFTTSDPEGTLRQNLGWTLPISGLRYWILSLPSPRSEFNITLDQDGACGNDAGRLAARIHRYVSVQRFGAAAADPAQPGRSEAARAIDTWSDLPP